MNNVSPPLLPIGGSSFSVSSLFTRTNAAILVAVIVMSFIVYYFFIAPSSKKQDQYKPNSEHASDSSSGDKSAELLFFYADWCPHCKTAKPIWEELKAEYAKKTVNGYHIIFTDINCSEETAEVERMMNQYSIEGYPTIKLLKDGQVIEYDAKPSRDTLVQFLNTVL
jgi:thiol-disulfide isomerase/thioredoxin